MVEQATRGGIKGDTLTRITAVCVTVLSAAFVLWPVLANQADSFPLSTFPMFASDRKLVTLGALKGVNSVGERVSIPPKLLGTDEVMQARATIQAAAQSGKRAALALCKQAAAAAAKSRAFSDLDSLEVTLDDYDPIQYFTDSRVPLHTQRVAHCVLPSRADAARGETENPPSEESQ